MVPLTQGPFFSFIIGDAFDGRIRGRGVLPQMKMIYVCVVL